MSCLLIKESEKCARHTGRSVMVRNDSTIEVSEEEAQWLYRGFQKA